MKKGFFNQRMPTVFALILLIVSIAISTLFVQQGINYISRATNDTQPLNLMVTNITDTSFTVVFTTTGFVDGQVVLKDAQIGSSLIPDDRDKKNGAQNKYYSHHITVPNLMPNTSYSFQLLVGGKDYTDPSYTVTTGPKIANQPPNQNPIFGKVLMTDGLPASDTLITVTTAGAQRISGFTNDKGEFMIPLNSFRSSNNANYFTIQNNTLFSVNAYRQNLSAIVTADYNLAQNLPPITLLQSYSFITSDQSQATASSQLQLPENLANRGNISINFPKEGQNISDSRPLFNGSALPNQQVKVTIDNTPSQNLNSTTGGGWSYRPDTDFSQGAHTITIETPDSTNRTVKITRNFTLLPLGSQVAESATPSATVTPKPSPTTAPTSIPTPTPTLSANATPIPTAAQPTATPTVEPPTATPTVIASVTLPINPTKPIPKPSVSPGAAENSLILTGVSLILIIAGTAILFTL